MSPLALFTLPSVLNASCVLWLRGRDKRTYILATHHRVINPTAWGRRPKIYWLAGRAQIIPHGLIGEDERVVGARRTDGATRIMPALPLALLAERRARARPRRVMRLKSSHVEPAGTAHSMDTQT